MEDLIEQITATVYSGVAIAIYSCVMTHLLSMCDLLQQVQGYSFMNAAKC